MPAAEQQRLDQDRLKQLHWRRWGPYVSERAWGTVREDYSADGNAWSCVTHDHARSKAFRWGEDGIGAICDRYQLLVFAPVFWNGRDPILKERLFGLVPTQTNHGEDVREYYFHADATPTHSYLKYIYKYPHGEYPYQNLVRESQRRNTAQPEYELLDTGIFAENRYFDIVIEYAKADPEDQCIRITIHNRGPEDATIHVLPHLWFRNTWAWGEKLLNPPEITVGEGPLGTLMMTADDALSDPLPNLPFIYRLGQRHLYGETRGRMAFTDNETNTEKLYGRNARNRSEYTKDAFHRWLIDAEPCINPENRGSKACFDYERTVPANGSIVLKLRFTNREMADPLGDVDAIVDLRKSEADEFYASIHPPKASDDEKHVQRSALAGMIWTRQIYLFDVNLWLEGDNETSPPPKSRENIRNHHWRHLNSMRVLSVPDKWEYPWFAAWDLAFHCVPFALIDPEFAKEQLWLLLFEQFQHPNGQIPAYEWEYSDLNPPVHAWAVLRVYNLEGARHGRKDRLWLEKCFHKLLLNFTWWVNKVDNEGNNVFEGGFLGLDNITLIDRSTPLTDGSTLKQSDASGWMGMFSLNMMRIALELAEENEAYLALAVKYFQHYVYIGAAMQRMVGRDFALWSESEGFFYDVLIWPDETYHKFRVRSMVGLIPLFAIEMVSEDDLKRFGEFEMSFRWFLKNRHHITDRCVRSVEHADQTLWLLALVDSDQLTRVLQRVWDASEFRSDYGLRSLSKAHQEAPFHWGGMSVGYEPAEAVCQIKGGNSNWRGPIWFPTAFLMIESLTTMSKVFRDKVHIPGSGGEGPVSPDEMARGFADRLIAIFTRDESGRRPVNGDCPVFQNDPHWKDLILFYEYFNGDTGKGLGASHQTGWTGLVATLIDEWRR